MNVLGVNFTKNDLRFYVLDGQTNPPTIIEKNKIVYPINMDTAELMEWFNTQFNLLIICNLYYFFKNNESFLSLITYLFGVKGIYMQHSIIIS
jgi:hypothetical protein